MMFSLKHQLKMSFWLGNQMKIHGTRQTQMTLADSKIEINDVW